ncbi:HemK methyltransferase family member 1 [Portunus trituberculatus]|uniref:HemK methyltransferase family member 1 n=1 Tax=Portunus trituberculatus TaxID=210409 RepID=A0A5B7D5S9_PORTR|nr:HemK methyltransferase family member 1 [Portunus trituberculatus]
MSPSVAKKTRKSLILEVKLDIIHRHERDRGKCDQVTSRIEGQGTTATTTTSYVSCVVREVVDHWTQKLAIEEVPEGDLAAQHIMAHVLGVRRSELQRPAIAETELSEEQMEEVDRLMTCRIARMPLQYILGEWDFHSLTLKMAPPVFIPRPETEGLVELAIGVLREMESPQVLEIGCGNYKSLVIITSTPHLKVECVAVDQSRHAVRLTESNAVQLGLKERLTVVLGKVNKDTRPPLPHSSYDLVVYEDLRALDGGKDGLEMIKALVLHAQHLLLPGRTLLMEVDPCHPYLLPAWLEKQNLHLKLQKVHQDFNNKDRIMEFIKEI